MLNIDGCKPFTFEVRLGQAWAINVVDWNLPSFSLKDLRQQNRE